MVDEVDDHLPGVQGVRVQGQVVEGGPDARRHADGRRLDDKVRPGHIGARPHPPGRPGERRCRLGARQGPVHHHHLGGTRVGQGQDDSPCRPTGADHHAALVLGVERLGSSQRGQEAFAVGAVPDQDTVTSAHAIDHPEPAGHVGRVVDHRVGRLLVRHGDRQPRQSEGAHPRQGTGRRSRRDRERDRDPVEAERVECGVVQQRREGMGDGVAHDPHHGGGAAGPGG